MQISKFNPKRTFPTEEHRPYIVIAGSGPSAVGYGKVDVATKKLTVPADYIVARHIAWWHRGERKRMNFMVYKGADCPKYTIIDRNRFYSADWKYWDQYFASFNPERITKKPSTGTCAVFCAYERWRPKKIGLIGFDWVLDGNEGWNHDPNAERRCIQSLVDIVDLRALCPIQCRPSSVPSTGADAEHVPESFPFGA